MEKSLVIFCAFLALVVFDQTSALNYKVHLFYYPWYGAPPFHSWTHWNSNAGQGHNPDDGDITSNYYPVLGPYDSCDPNVLEQHMQWISSTGAGTIISSWWGQGSYEDGCVNQILDAANNHDIKVGFHIEPYGGRSPESVVGDINYINQQYGNHPAYFRDPDFGNRDAFYIFYSLEFSDWTAIGSLRDQHIILAQTTDQSVQNFGGFYNYAIGDGPADGFRGMSDFCKNNGLVWSPSIGPGYIDRRAVPDSTATIFDRRDGAMYDQNWSNVFESNSTQWVSITSFNEWHEGSMIEPASSSPPAGIDYMTFDGAYGRNGPDSETAYLERTAYYVAQYTALQKAVKGA